MTCLTKLPKYSELDITMKTCSGSYFPLTLVITILLVGILFAPSTGITPIFPGGVENKDKEFLDLLNECTTGVASGLVTPDGRPLLWKNRDVGNSNQEYHYVDDGRIPFIGLCYRNENSWQYYAGINAHGFALENSNSYNLPRGPASNGFGAGDDDGEIHMLALSTCRTVDDFQDLMDSLDVDGRTHNSNYGCFDAFGGAAMFETGGYEYRRVDAAETRDGFCVRSNYSYWGNGLDNRPQHWGPNRHDRAFALFKDAAEDNTLTAKLIFQQVSRNVGASDMDNYELPYRGYHKHYPWGLIPNGDAICRSTTASVFIGQGVREDEHPSKAIIWTMCGDQIGSIATPLWVRAGSVPLEHDGPNGSRLCSVSSDISDWVYQSGVFGRAVNTFKLHNDDGSGYWDWSFGLEDYVFERVERFMNQDNFSPDLLEIFQNTLARQVADSIEAWTPGYEITEIHEPVFLESRIDIFWEEDFEPDNPRGYKVFRSPTPFRAGDNGDLLGFVEQCRFSDNDPLDSGGFYRVEVVY